MSWHDTLLFASARTKICEVCESIFTVPEGKAKTMGEWLEVARLLIAAGADVNQANDDGLTPLMSAVGFDNTALVKLLLSAGADSKPHDKSGRTALDFAKHNRSDEIIQMLRSVK